MKAVGAIVVLLLVAPTISSQDKDYVVPSGSSDFIVFQTGNDLLRKCQSSSVVDKGACLGYVTGVVDHAGIIQTSIVNGNRIWRFPALCLPTQAEVGQTKDVVVGFLTRHPERRAEPAAALTMASLMEVWKCPGT